MCVLLPEIIELTDYGGNVDDYENVIHEKYLNIFRNPPIYFRTKSIIPIVYPIQHKGRHWTFSHLTSNGYGSKIENERQYDLRRCERVVWIKPILENIDNPCLKKWRQTSRHKNRIAIWDEVNEILIVLEEAKRCFKLITTFLPLSIRHIDHYRDEYNEYLRLLQIGTERPI